jgi:hypothetical protein
VSVLQGGNKGIRKNKRVFHYLSTLWEEHLGKEIKDEVKKGRCFDVVWMEKEIE